MYSEVLLTNHGILIQYFSIHDTLRCVYPVFQTKPRWEAGVRMKCIGALCNPGQSILKKFIIGNDNRCIGGGQDLFCSRHELS